MNTYKRYNAVMILCFLFGGFSILSYALQAYSLIWQPDLAIAIRGEAANFVSGNSSGNLTDFGPRPHFSDPYGIILSPSSLVLFFTGIVSLLAGFAIMGLTRDKEMKITKKTVIDSFLVPDEKKVYDDIEKQGGSAKQSDIVKNTGLSRVKVHRIVKNLEKKNLVMKQQYGMTNKIVLKK